MSNIKMYLEANKKSKQKSKQKVDKITKISKIKYTETIFKWLVLLT